MGITVNTSPQQITASVGETQIDVTVGGGVGPTGATGPAGPAGSSYTLPTATASVLGGVKIGSGITIDGSGVISASSGYTLPTATNFVLGGVKIGSGVTITDGVISVSTNYAAASHTHATSEITGLDATLSGIDTAISNKAASAHASQHLANGSDPVFDQNLNQNSVVIFAEVVVSDPASNDLILSASGITFPDDTVQETAYTGKIGTTSGLIVTTGTDGVLGTLAQGTAGQHLRVNSGATGVEWVTLGGAASLNVGTTAGTVAAGDHTHTQLHDRSHAITSSSDHTATAWRLFYSNGSGVITELTLGSSGQALLSNGASAAPSWGSAGSNSASDLTVGTLAYARMADPTVTSPSQITASQNDYASFARGINRFTTNAARDLTGMVAGADGEVRVLCNVGTTAANTLTIKDESSSSTAANRFSVPWNSDCVIQAEGSVVVFYDGTSQRWRVL